MNTLETRLKRIDSNLFAKFEETKVEVNLMLGKYASNFPTYTDHSANHTLEVFKIASEILSDEEIDVLDADEIYILSMACLLHDIGMCVPEKRIEEISESQEILAYKDSHPNLTTEEFIRDIHHKLSNKFILQEWEMLNIPSIKYARAIGLVAEGHRKVDLGDFEIYNPQYFAKSGKEFACLPYLSCILRIADELDVTNSRTPRILTKYYMPNNSISIREWSKHIATSQRNYLDNKVLFEVDCSDQNIYAALQEQFDKIQSVINTCQKVIRSIPFIKSKHYALSLSLVNIQYNFIGFHPKGIRFSFDVQNVVTAFIGEDLYKDNLTSLREAVQNSIDSCRYKSKVLKEVYIPNIKISLTDEYLRIEDNGAGMDEFIIENFFGRLASSFYEQDKIKTQFEAIGQFGVGVFSYFLLSEFIDIETKTIKSSALKFRFDKDPKSYFHFYDKTERNTPGTTITMHLKKELVGKLTFNIIEAYIKKIFKHIEIPIELNAIDSKTVIEFQPFEINSTLEIRDRLKLQHKKIASQLKTVVATVRDEDIEGICALIIGKDYLNTFKYASYYYDSDQFRTISNRHAAYSQISMSQKGVFVNKYSSPSLSLLVGDIDLKKKVKINIDRNEFTDIKQIYRLVQRCEIKILRELFATLEEKYNSDEERLNVSDDFLNRFLHYDSEIVSKEYVDIIINAVYVRSMLEKQESIFKIKNTIGTYNEFILIVDKEDSESISLNAKMPVIIANETKYFGYYQNLSRIFVDFLGYSERVILIKGKYYKNFGLEPFDANYIKDLVTIKEIFGSYFFHCKPVNSKNLVVSIWQNKDEFADSDYYDDEEIYFNYNHHFIKYVIAHHIEIKNSAEYKKIIKSVFYYLQELAQEEFNKDHIDKLNEIILPLNSVSKLKKFRLRDFQHLK